MAQFKFDPSKLDMAQIKDSLKRYFEASGQFNDYDFEGSGLSALLDVLAYNTHLQAMTANFATNEAFLDTAQLRGSVVSHAKPLGYLPRSRRSSYADVTLSLNSVPSLTPDIVIPKYTKFTTNIDGQVYTFYTLDEYTATDSNSYTVTARIYEGKLLKKRFIVDSDQNDYPIYVIPDANADTSTMSVVVAQGLNSTASEAYSVPTKIGNLTPDDTNYFIYESPNGYYEIMLGDNFIGKKPTEGSVVDCTYLQSRGPDGNGASTFASSDTVSGYTVNTTLVAKSTGGAERESMNSIRFNAPKAFSAQNRAVTTDDYKTFLQQELSYIETLNVWGGEENDPPEYGTVFISIKPTDADALNDERKSQIRTNVLGTKNIITIEPKFVDPEFQYLEVKMNVRYDPSATPLTQSQLQNKVKASILEYGTTNLAAFESTFRKSRLLSFIDDSDDSVLTVSADIFAQRRLIPELGVKARYELPFTLGFASVTNFETVVTSDVFEYQVDGVTYNCSLRNKRNSTQLEIFRSGSNGEVIVVDNAGFIDTTNNKVVLVPFEPSGIKNATEGIRFSARPADENTINPRRNLLIRIDELLTAVNAEED